MTFEDPAVAVQLACRELVERQLKTCPPLGARSAVFDPEAQTERELTAEAMGLGEDQRNCKSPSLGPDGRAERDAGVADGARLAHTLPKQIEGP